MFCSSYLHLQCLALYLKMLRIRSLPGQKGNKVKLRYNEET